jgi:transcriptional regulator with XRE-family HTH domain
MAATFSEQLRQAIKDSGWSGYAIAKETGIPQSQLSLFMNDKGGLQQSNIDKVCRLIGARLVAGPTQKPKGKPTKSRGRRKR